MAKPKIFFHTSYIGQGGYNNHAQNFIHELSKLAPLKIRNFSISPNTWKGLSDEPHNKEPYITDKDKKLLNYQALWSTDNVKDNYWIIKFIPNTLMNLTIMLILY